MYLLMYSLNNSTAPIENFEKAAYTETQNAGFPTHPLDADRFSVHEEDMTQQLFDKQQVHYNPYLRAIEGGIIKATIT